MSKKTFADGDEALTIASVSGVPLVLLRVEDAAMLAAAVVVYAHVHESWWWFAGLFLVPDISMLAYVRGPRLGALCYNAAHTSTFAFVLVGVGWWQHYPLVLCIGLIWLAHIAFDRMLGYGLKYPTGFGDTHLGPLGRTR